MDLSLVLAVLAYLTALFLLSLYARRRVHSEQDYVVAGRRLPLWLAWGTLMATWFGAATVLGAAQAARDEGVRGTLLDPFASGLALILAGLFFARPMWRMQLLTVGDFFARRFGPRSERIASLLLIPGYLGWVGAQLVALGGLQEAFFSIPMAAGIFVAALVILAYTWSGGMWSVTLTDTLQLGVLMVGLVVLAHAVFASMGEATAAEGLQRVWRNTEPDARTLWPAAGLPLALLWWGTLASGSLGNIPGQDLMQRVFAARSASTAAWACLLAGGAYLGLGLLPVLMGLAARQLDPQGTSGDVLGALAAQLLSPTMRSVLVVSLISVIVSTATSAVLSPATVLAHNLLGRWSIGDARPLLRQRLCVLLVVLGSVAMAFSGESILDLLEMSVSTVLVGLFVPLVMGIYGRPRGERGAMLAMLLGIVVWGARESLELWSFPPAEGVEAADFPNHVAQMLGSGPLGAILAPIGWAFALLPAALSGLLASALGYALGHFTSAAPPAPALKAEAAEN